MRIGVLGSGNVGRTLATAFAEHGHEVMLGARTVDSDVIREWQANTAGQVGTLHDAATFGDIVVNALKGDASLAAIVPLGEALTGKVLLDVANPLDFSKGFPPSFTVSNTDSLGEQLQRALPSTAVVKGLNTVNTSVMVAPGALSQATDLFICGDDAAAKVRVVELLGELGWDTERVHDLGDIAAARGTEAYLALWVRLMSMMGTATFNVRVVTE